MELSLTQDMSRGLSSETLVDLTMSLVLHGQAPAALNLLVDSRRPELLGKAIEKVEERDKDARFPTELMAKADLLEQCLVPIASEVGRLLKENGPAGLSLRHCDAQLSLRSAAFVERLAMSMGQDEFKAMFLGLTVHPAYVGLPIFRSIAQKAGGAFRAVPGLLEEVADRDFARRKEAKNVTRGLPLAVGLAVDGDVALMRRLLARCEVSGMSVRELLASRHEDDSGHRIGASEKLCGDSPLGAALLWGRVEMARFLTGLMPKTAIGVEKRRCLALAAFLEKSEYAVHSAISVEQCAEGASLAEALEIGAGLSQMPTAKNRSMAL